MAALSIVVRPKQGHQPHQAVVILPLETGPELGWTGACAGSVARETIEAFCDADTQRMRSVLAPGLRAFITNRDGGVDQADAEEYLRRVAAMDLRNAQLRLTITQMVTPRPDMVLAMVEVSAARGGKRLDNHAAHCLFVRGGLVAEWWMVEALPAESDAFWSS